MPIDANALMDLLKAGGEKVADFVKDGAKDFFKENVAQNDFLKESGRALFTLGIELAKATSDDERERIKDRIQTVKDGMTSELWSIAVDASAATRSKIKHIVDAAVKYAVEILPVAAKILLSAA